MQGINFSSLPLLKPLVIRRDMGIIGQNDPLNLNQFAGHCLHPMLHHDFVVGDGGRLDRVDHDRRMEASEKTIKPLHTNPKFKY